MSGRLTGGLSQRLSRALGAGARLAWQPGNRLVLLPRGATYFPALESALAAARQEVLFETYLYESDPAGDRVTQALCAAARRGVHVCLTIDGAGAKALSASYRDAFAAAGVHWAFYRPFGSMLSFLWSRTTARRMHRKICVIDGTVAFIGGINVIDDLNVPQLGDAGAPTRPRLDFACRVEGPVVADIHRAAASLWQGMRRWRRVKSDSVDGKGTAMRGVRGAGAEAAASVEGGAVRTSPRKSLLPSRRAAPLMDGHVSQAALAVRDNVRHRRAIERAYLEALHTAKHDFTLANAYFMPSRRLMRALRQAQARGVQLRVLTQGHSDHRFMQHAAVQACAPLLAQGAKVYQYTASELHAKVAVADVAGERPWATVGSSNIDALSLTLAREANLVVHDDAFARQLHRELQHAITHDAQELTATSLAARPWWQALRDKLAYAFVSTMGVVVGYR
jgi:cardiolipin synthase A/B